MKNAISCEVNEEEKTIFVSGADTYGILSHIVGIISFQGLFITQAKSKVFEKDTELFFEDVFHIQFSETKQENWYEEIPKLIKQQTDLIYKKKYNEAQKNIIELFVEYFSRNIKTYKIHPIVAVDINNKEDCLEIIIHGEDISFLLYIISLAIEYQNLSIINFSIHTKKHYIEDVFYIKKPKDMQKSDAENTIQKIRFSLIANIQFAYLLQKSPNPYEAFTRLQEMLSEVETQDISQMISFFISENDKKEGLATLLGASDFLWQHFIRTHTAEVMQLITTEASNKTNTIDLDEELIVLMDKETTYQDKTRVLNEFKDKKIFEMDINNIIYDQQDIIALSAHLSELAKIVIRQAAFLVQKKIQSLYGTPLSSVGHISDWALFALGKLGGSALGYASDVEFIFIYEDKGETNGKDSISNREYFEIFVKEITHIITASEEGIFKIDLRLRPYGDAGPLAVRLNNFIEYYSSSKVPNKAPNKAHSIEILALTRMRPLVGNPRLVERVLRITKSILYEQNSFDIKTLLALRKKQIEQKINGEKRNAKFSLGALVDVEYSVQILQLQYGRNNIDLQQPSIHNALQVLHNMGEISEKDSLFLLQAYRFFRKLINALRMRRGNARDLTLPDEDTWKLEHLARRMNYTSDELSAGEKLLFDFDNTAIGVHSFMQTLFGEDIKNLDDTILNPGRIVYEADIEKVRSLLKHFENPIAAFESIQRCVRDEESKKLFSQLLLLGWVRIIRRGDANLVLLTIERIIESFDDAELVGFYTLLLKQPKSFSVLIDIFVTSRFLSEEIIKNPKYIFDFLRLKNMRREKSIDEYQKDIDNSFMAFMAFKTFVDKTISILDKKNIIREFRKTETLRIMIRDVCIQAPLPHICSEISSLAQVLIQKAFLLSCEDEEILPKGIAILAFGKLGSNELNYSSDIDLMCVYDAAICEYDFLIITKMFRNTIQYLTDYTSFGIAYRIDLRLRPFGEGGDIVINVESFKIYYEQNAQLWEIQAGLKLSCVGGDASVGTACCTLMQEISQKKLATYNKKDIIDTIHRMRKKSVATHIKHQQGDGEVKNSWGGIRDIEFTIQALLLIHYDKRLHREKQTTLDMLQTLTREGIVSLDTKTTITKHYLFLRKIEHFLQVYEDKQIHAFTESDATLIKRLSWLLMEETDEDSFLNKLQGVKKEVQAWYESVFIQHIF